MDDNRTPGVKAASYLLQQPPALKNKKKPSDSDIQSPARTGIDYDPNPCIETRLGVLVAVLAPVTLLSPKV